MRLAWLCAYIGGLLAVIFVLSSLVTYAPDAQNLGDVVRWTVGVSALAVIGLTLLLHRLPPEHWINHSRPLWAIGVAVAITVTLALFVIG